MKNRPPIFTRALSIHAVSSFCLAVLALSLSCCSVKVQAADIVDFDSCVAAGNKVLRSYPPKCVAEGGKVFVKQIVPETLPEIGSENGTAKTACVDKCGDGTCAEMVCQAIGCPCAETHESCPADCPSLF